MRLDGYRDEHRAIHTYMRLDGYRDEHRAIHTYMRLDGYRARRSLVGLSVHLQMPTSFTYET